MQADRQRVNREQAQERVTAFLDVTLGLLAFVALVLLLAEISLNLQEPWPTLIVRAQIAIWVLFIVGFVAELVLAPSKTKYLQSNWLVALSLALPARRVFGITRAGRVLRTTRSVRLFGLACVGTAFNRAWGVLRTFLNRSRFAYLAILTALVVITGYFLENGSTQPLDSVWDGLWWSATLITTVNSQDEPLTLEGRLIGLILRLYGVGVFGYLTAHLAAYVLGDAGPGTPRGAGSGCRAG